MLRKRHGNEKTCKCGHGKSSHRKSKDACFVWIGFPGVKCKCQKWVKNANRN